MCIPFDENMFWCFDDAVKSWIAIPHLSEKS